MEEEEDDDDDVADEAVVVVVGFGCRCCRCWWRVEEDVSVEEAIEDAEERMVSCGSCGGEWEVLVDAMLDVGVRRAVVGGELLVEAVRLLRNMVGTPMRVEREQIWGA